MSTKTINLVDDVKAFLKDFANEWRFTMLQDNLASFNNKASKVWIIINTLTGIGETTNNGEESTFEVSKSAIKQISKLHDNKASKPVSLDRLFSKTS